jgi:hypothetical protein
MWVVRALVNLLVHVAVTVLVTLGVAALWALAHGGGYLDSFRISCFVFACLLLLFGVGGHQRVYNSVVPTPGRLPGMPAWLEPDPADKSLTTSAVFLLTAVALLAIALALEALR